MSWEISKRDLVGTSCTGLIIPVVSTFRPIEHLVFVCAGLPDIGRSATDQIFGDALLHEDWVAYSGAPDSEDAAKTFMFNDCDGATLDWALATVRLWMPQPAYDEITPLEAWPDIPSTYVLGTRDRIINQGIGPSRRDDPLRATTDRAGYGALSPEQPTRDAGTDPGPKYDSDHYLTELAPTPVSDHLDAPDTPCPNQRSQDASEPRRQKSVARAQKIGCRERRGAADTSRMPRSPESRRRTPCRRVRRRSR